jgi:hypothetical protein
MKILFSLLFAFAITTVVAQKKAEFKFISETIDYGKIGKGANGKRVFEFTNIGDEPLIITNIKAACGCTVPKKPEAPIMPGEIGIIEISYDTAKPGRFSKNITIFSNAKTTRKTLRVKGFVTKGISLEKERNMLSEN